MRSWHRSSPQTIRDLATRRFSDDVDRHLTQVGQALTALQQGKQAASTGASTTVQQAGVAKLQSAGSAVVGTPTSSTNRLELLDQVDLSPNITVVADGGQGGLFLLHLVVVCTAGDALMNVKLQRGGIENSYPALNVQLANFNPGSVVAPVPDPTPWSPDLAYRRVWEVALPIYLQPAADYPDGALVAFWFSSPGALGTLETFTYNIYSTATAL